jgi:tRNA(Ile)-lysidine synthase
MAALSPLWPEGRYVCAFSGGCDSTALLALLAAALPPERILAAHLDHRLREGSGGEAVRAAARARRLGLECLVEARDVGALAGERGKGIEEAARLARYEFLESVRLRWGGDFILTAHQAEDQAETIILKLARGGGPGALAGIRAGNGRILRPLLGFSRAELAGWLALSKLEWIEDASNLDRRFRRNQVRQDVLPALAALNPAYLWSMARAAELAAAEEDFWDRRVGELEAELVEAEPGGWFSLESARFNNLGLAERRRLAGRLARRVVLPGPGGGEPAGFKTVEGVLELARRPGAGGLDLPGGRRVEWRGRRIRIGPASRFFKPDGAAAPDPGDGPQVTANRPWPAGGGPGDGP